MKYVKNRTLKILHLNAVKANFCCFIICNFRLLLPEPLKICQQRLLLKVFILGGQCFLHLGFTPTTHFNIGLILTTVENRGLF